MHTRWKSQRSDPKTRKVDRRMAWRRVKRWRDEENCLHSDRDGSYEAEQIPFPDVSTAADKVFAPTPEIALKEEYATKGESIVMVDALNHAIDEEMEKDPLVVVFGEDVLTAREAFLASPAAWQRNTASKDVLILRLRNLQLSVLL